MTDTKFIRETLCVAQATARAHNYPEHAEDCAKSIEMIGALAKWKREQEDEASSKSRHKPE